MLKEKSVVKCIVLTKELVDKINALVGQIPQSNQSKIIRKILTKYFNSVEI